MRLLTHLPVSTVLSAILALAGLPMTAAAAPGNGVPQQLAAIEAQVSAILAEVSALEIGGASVKAAQRSEGLVVDAQPGSVNTLVSVTGPGKFVSARLTKQGGDTGLTAVRLILDGRTVVGRNIVALKNLGMTQHNSYGVSVFTSAAGIDAVTIGFPQPLEFETSLELQAVVGDDVGIEQMIGTVIHGQ